MQQQSRAAAATVQGSSSSSSKSQVALRLARCMEGVAGWDKKVMMYRCKSCSYSEGPAMLLACSIGPPSFPQTRHSSAAAP